MAPVQPSQEVLDRRKFVEFTDETITNTSNTEYPHFYPGETHEWSIDKFRDSFRVIFHDVADQGLEAIFSLVGLDASIANAFRRILIAEVPSLAIESVYVKQNTSILHDEVLSARLGLIPLVGSLEGMRWLKRMKKPIDDDGNAVQEPLTDRNCVRLNLEVDCKWADGGFKAKQQNPRAADHEVYINSHVYASQLKFQPLARQEQIFANDPIRPSSDKILIAKLRPGQRMNLIIDAVKGIGADHAKFSPVATASYRLLPQTIILKPILGADAKKFARCFPKGIVKIETVTAEEARKEGSGHEGKEGELKAVISNRMDDMLRDPVTRECLRHDEFKGKVKLGRVRDHFVFSVESTGQYPSEELFIESVKILKAKCAKAKKALSIMTY